MAGPAGSGPPFGPGPGAPRSPRPPRALGAPALGIARPPCVLSLAIEGAARGGAAVLGPIRLEIAAGETVALAGPSGIGKTTLLRIAAGLDAPRGTLRAPARRALIFQEPTLLPWRTARANLRIAARVDAREADGWLDRVGLGGLGARYPMSLSLGQQRRLSLARAFASRPALLLMDEPFVSLDAAAAAAMMALFEDLRQRSGAATLLVTHAIEEARRLADRVLTLGGRPAVIVEMGGTGTSPAEMGPAEMGPAEMGPAEMGAVEAGLAGPSGADTGGDQTRGAQTGGDQTGGAAPQPGAVQPGAGSVQARRRGAGRRADPQNMGLYRHSSASGVASPGS